MEVKQNIASNATAVKEIYQQYTNKTEVELEYQIFQNWNLEKSVGYFDERQLIGFAAVSEKTLINESHIYKVALIEDAMFDKARFDKNLKKDILIKTFDHLKPYYDSVCIHATNWKDVDVDMELEDALVVNEVEFIAGEYPTPMLMTWNEPKPELIASIEQLDGEDRIGVERSFAQISLDIRCKQNQGLSFLANPFAYVWYDDNSKKIKEVAYNETAQLTWLLNQIQPKGTFYMYANYDFNEIPCLKVVKQNIVIVKTFKPSKTIIKNIKFTDLN